VIVHCERVTSTLKYAVIVGRAILTTVPSMTDIMMPMRTMTMMI
jgi:hypothetical protein